MWKRRAARFSEVSSARFPNMYVPLESRLRRNEFSYTRPLLFMRELLRAAGSVSGRLVLA